jgi:hypothetical protein
MCVCVCVCVCVRARARARNLFFVFIQVSYKVCLRDEMKQVFMFLSYVKWSLNLNWNGSTVFI